MRSVPSLASFPTLLSRLAALALALALLVPASAAQGPAAPEPPVVAAERDRNAAYAKRQAELQELLEATVARTAVLDRESDTLSRLVASEQRRIGTGRSEVLGAAFLRELIRLREARQVQREAIADHERTLDLDLRILDLSERLDELRDIDQAAEGLLAAQPLTPGADRAAALAALQAVLLEQRDGLLVPLIAENRTAAEALVRLGEAQKRLVAEVEAYRTFIFSNLLWLRVSEPSGPIVFVRGCLTALLLVRDAGWTAALGAVWEGTVATPMPWLAALAGLLALLAARGACRRTLDATAELVARAGTDRFGYTLRATLATFVLALPVPAIGWFLWDRLTKGVYGDQLSAAIGSAIYRDYWLVALLAFVIALARPNGLGARHFRWNAHKLRQLRRGAWLLLATAVPLKSLSIVLIVGLRAESEAAGASESLLILAGLAWLAIFAWLAHPRIGIFSEWLDRNREGFLFRTRWFWYAAIVAIPLALTLIAWQGYLFAALVGMEKMGYTLGVVMLVRVGRVLCLRWLSATSRRIAIEQDERRRAAEREAATAAALAASSGMLEEQAPGSGVVVATAAPAATPEPEVDLGEINAQTVRIITSISFTVFVLSVLAVWSDLLPALEGLRSIVLWTISREVPVEAGGMRKVILPVDLLDLISALIALVLTTVVTRNIPGLIELIVLPRLPLSAGARYAIVTLVRYVLGIVGGVIVLKFLGVDWQSVQWLVGAAVLGLSFGLQEIFKNLVSGVILLLEQPIRVGDLVTINGVTGRVTSIRMRATTVVDPDRRDMVIPNSAFITGQVTNWTLADRRTRQVIRIGVAYGSDLRRVERLLLDIADAEPEILKDPAPSVVLVDFGDSSVNFDLRVVLDDVSKLPGPVHRIKLAIAEELPRNGIEIPFPQRDLHLRSVDDGIRRLFRPEGTPLPKDA